MSDGSTARTLDQLIDSCIDNGWEYSLEPAGRWRSKDGKRFYSGPHRASVRDDESGVGVTVSTATPNEALLRAMAGMLAALEHEKQRA